MPPESSSATSIDFHPSRHTLLLVGYSNGEITLREVGTVQKLLSESFKVWQMAPCSEAFQASGGENASISVNSVTWSPDGNYMVQLYAYVGPNDVTPQLQIDAHVGGVNDIAFFRPNKQLCVVTCGDDTLIKVWDMSGQELYNFRGHDAPVYSICSYPEENIQFIFSTSTDGRIKGWLYDNQGSIFDIDARGEWYTTMRYSADGRRLFCCGTSEVGASFLVEWYLNDEAVVNGSATRNFIFSLLSCGTIRDGLVDCRMEDVMGRAYVDYCVRKSAGVMQFDTTQNYFLAVGQDSKIKFWDMDSTEIFATTDADGGLSDLPYLRFNKEGNLLAVTTDDNRIKILANGAGLKSLTYDEAPLS